MGLILTYPKRFRVTEPRDEIIKRISSGRYESFIYVVPTRRKIRELRRELLSYARDETAPEFNLFTLDLLAHKLYSTAARQKPKKKISDQVLSLIFEKAIENSFERLIYFKTPEIDLDIKLDRELTRRPRGGLPRGTIDKLINVILGLKEDGIYPIDIKSEISSLRSSSSSNPTDVAKLSDIFEIYENYERLLNANNFIDTPGIFKELNSIVTEGEMNRIFKITFPDVDAIFIEGFSMFRVPEIEMIRKFTKVEGVQILIAFDYYERNNNLFEHLNDSYRRFLGAGFVKREIKPKTENDKFTRHLNRYLFNYIDKKFERFKAKHLVSVIKARDRVEEVRTIARIIKRIAVERRKIDLSRICVATYKPDKYTNLFREIFHTYGIPANITDRYKIERSPIITAIISLLEIPVNNYRVRDIVKALMSPYFNFRDARGIDAGNIYSVSSQLKIVDDRNFWISRVKSKLGIVKSRRESTSDPDEVYELTREEEQLERALRDYMDLMNILDEISTEKMSPSEFRDKLRSILRELEIEDQILKLPRHLATTDEIERDARAYQIFWMVVDEILETFEFNMRRREKYSLEYYVELLKTALSRTRYNIRQRYGYGVYVTTLDETRGLNFDVMIIAGLVDTEFPSVYEPEIFLSENLRKTEKMHRLDERYLFYQGVTNFKTHLYLLYPESDGENELVRSRFIDSLEQIAEVQFLDASEFEDGIYSMDELYDRYGRLLKSDPTGAVSQIDQFGDKLAEKFRDISELASISMSRIETHNMPEYEGIIEVKSEREKRKLEEHREKIFSVSQLETYGKCPFRYFAERVLLLQGIERIDELLTALERGILYHEIVFEFYSRWRREVGKPIAEAVEYACELIKDIARRKISEFAIRHPLWKIEVEELNENLLSFIKSEANPLINFEPRYFEVSFGPRTGRRFISDKELSTTAPIRIGNVKIQGKIDRIDILGNKFIVVDYKTGEISGQKDIEDGINLQLPLYIRVAEKIFKERKGLMVGVGAINYRLRGRDIRPKILIADRDEVKLNGRSGGLLPEDKYKKLIGMAEEFANRYVDMIVQGKFNLTEKDTSKVCKGCPFIEICRVREVKFATS
jgi:ATP-dependent helicase/nuclease subunit B